VARDAADPRDPSAVAPGTGPLLFIVFIMVASTSTLWPILTPYAKDLGAGGFELGLVVSAIYFTRLVLGPWVCRVGDRRGYR
jgi:MFS family permease